eukprot:jgi/Botrbrau1/3197/Bobra.37_2s0027.1
MRSLAQETLLWTVIVSSVILNIGAQPIVLDGTPRMAAVKGLPFEYRLNLGWPSAAVAKGVPQDLWVRVMATGKGPLSLVKLADTPNPFKINSTDASGNLWEQLRVKGIILDQTGAVPLEFDLSHDPSFKVASTHLGEQWMVSGPSTLVPLIITLAIAIITQEVLLALYSGIFWGCFVMYRFSLVAAFKQSWSTFILGSIADQEHAYVLIFSWVLGGMVAVLQRCGGAHGMAELIGSLAKGRVGGQLATFFSTFFIFFDSYGNELITGCTMRPITDKLYISREKLAFIVDTAAAALASIAPISSWIGFELSLIASELVSMADSGMDMTPYPRTAYLVFLETIATRFYPIGAIFIVFVVIVTKREYGPMLAAERRAMFDHKLVSDTADPSQVSVDETLEPNADTPRLWWNSLIPIGATLVTTIVGLVQTGAQKATEKNLELSIANIFGAADAYASLTWGAVCGAAAAFLLGWMQYKKNSRLEPLGLLRDARQQISCAKEKADYGVSILTLRESLEAWLTGMKNLTPALMVLVLAWGVGSTFKNLGAGQYISTGMSAGLPAGSIPVVIFCIACILSFATGTSWGTMSLLFPLAVPAAFKAAPGNRSIFNLTVSAILAGAIFGDHCTLISDTTILAALATKCDLVGHVMTQLPYAMTAGIFSAFLGYLPGGFKAFGPPEVCLITVLGGIVATVFLVGAPINGTRPDLFTLAFGKCFKVKEKSEEEVMEEMPETARRMSIQAVARVSKAVLTRLSNPDPTYLAAGGYRPTDLQAPKDPDPEGRDYLRPPTRQSMSAATSVTPRRDSKLPYSTDAASP